MIKRSTVIALCVALLMAGCQSARRPNSGDLARINIIDRNGFSETISHPDRLQKYSDTNFCNSQPYEKVVRVYHPDQQGNTRSYITSYYPNGQIRQYLEVYNGRAFGAYREWYENGSQKIEATVIGGNPDVGISADQNWLFDGITYAWSSCGDLEATIPYCKGSLHGVSTYYHSNGCVWKEIPFLDNLQEGKAIIYRPGGEVLQESSWCRGALEGPLVRYWDNGQVSAQECYCEGRLITGDYFDVCGSPISKIEKGNGFRPVFTKQSVLEMHEYRRGIPEGNVKLYTNNHQLRRQYSIKDEEKHGEEIVYFTDSFNNGKKLSVQWYEGKIHGIVRTWYPDGTLESQKEMSENKKNGLYTSWFKNGNLQMVEEYDQDILEKGEYYKKGDSSPISEVCQGKGIATIYDSEGNFVRKIQYLNGKPLQ